MASLLRLELVRTASLILYSTDSLFLTRNCSVNENLSILIDGIQKTNVQLRQQLELAEAQIPRLNEALQQLARLEFATGYVLLDEIIHEAAYPAGGPCDSGQLFQAAIVIPGGLGVIIWDTGEFEQLSDT